MTSSFSNKGRGTVLDLTLTLALTHPNPNSFSNKGRGTVLDRLAEISRSEILNHKKRFPLVWSSLIYFSVHQPAATNSMHLQSTCTQHLQHIQSDLLLESSQTSAMELFCGNSQRIKAIGYFRWRAPSWIFDRILNATLPNNFLHLHQIFSTFCRMFQDISRNVWWHSPECLATFPGMFEDIAWNVWRHSHECFATFPGI